MPVAHYENFPVASWFVPGALRPAIVAIYAFARGADDIADEGDDPPAVRLAKLDGYVAMLERIATGDVPREPPFAALAASVHRYRLPLELLHDLLSAFRQDVVKKRYTDYDDVLDYCRRSANPIGRLLLHLYGVATPENLSHADAICTGLQLTNFWQDIALDWDKGRVYLPAADMARYGVSEGQIAASRCDERWRQLLAFEVERTRALLVSGRPLARALPWRLRLELKMVIAGGLRILDAIDATRGDVFHRRPILHAGDWVAMAAAAVVD